MIQLKDKTFKPFIPAPEIQKRVAVLAHEIEQEFIGKNPIFICILKGAFLFAADLMKHIKIMDCEVTFVRLSSYEGMASSGSVKEFIPMPENLKDRHVVIIEDIVDSGKTLHEFIPKLQNQQPAQIKIATLLFKPNKLQYPIQPDFTGFTISDEFVVGYGLDYDEFGRNLPDIYQVVE